VGADRGFSLKWEGYDSAVGQRRTDRGGAKSYLVSRSELLKVGFQKEKEDIPFSGGRQ